jgi:putative tryptophan/tyrosine transport system substrate-binding protein
MMSANGPQADVSRIAVAGLADCGCELSHTRSRCGRLTLTMNNRNASMRGGGKMNRRKFITLLSGAACTWPLGAWAQQVTKIYRVGVLETRSRAQNPNFIALVDELRNLGYVEGRNLLIEYRSAEGQADLFPELAAELLRLKVDVIVTRGTPATLAAKKATTSIPIVMSAIGEAAAVNSLARPGVSELTNELQVKRIEALKELLPHLKRVALLSNLGNPSSVSSSREVQSAAQILGIELRVLDVRNAAGIAPAFDTAQAEQVDGLLVVIDGLFEKNVEQIVALAAMHRLPAIYASKEFVEAGGLVAYGPSYPDLYRRAAAYVDKVLKGEKPANLPVEQPIKFELTINLKAAKALGITIPPSLLGRADEVIE